MIKDVEIQGRLYQIDTTPPLSPSGFRSRYAEVYEVRETPASGRVAGVLRELGKEPVIRHLTPTDPETEHKVVLALGWKFSRSRAWRNLYNLHSLREKSFNS